jgi:hypothetical protein
MNLTDRELATVRAALRFWRDEMGPHPHGGSYADHFEGHAPLTAGEIDALCERLNERGNPADDEREIEAAREESFKTSWPYVPGVFRKRFVSPFDQYADRVGQRFTVVRTYTPAETAALCGVPEEEAQEMYRIRFEDGTEIDAWAEEVCVASDGPQPERRTP